MRRQAVSALFYVAAAYDGVLGAAPAVFARFGVTARRWRGCRTGLSKVWKTRGGKVPSLGRNGGARSSKRCHRAWTIGPPRRCGGSRLSFRWADRTMKTLDRRAPAAGRCTIKAAVLRLMGAAGRAVRARGGATGRIQLARGIGKERCVMKRTGLTTIVAVAAGLTLAGSAFAQDGWGWGDRGGPGRGNGYGWGPSRSQGFHGGQRFESSPRMRGQDGQGWSQNAPRMWQRQDFGERGGFGNSGGRFESRQRFQPRFDGPQAPDRWEGFAPRAQRSWGFQEQSPRQGWHGGEASGQPGPWMMQRGFDGDPRGGFDRHEGAQGREGPRHWRIDWN